MSPMAADMLLGLKTRPPSPTFTVWMAPDEEAVVLAAAAAADVLLLFESLPPY